MLNCGNVLSINKSIILQKYLFLYLENVIDQKNRVNYSLKTPKAVKWSSYIPNSFTNYNTNYEKNELSEDFIRKYVIIRKIVP